jgi:hypothetical protein
VVLADGHGRRVVVTGAQGPVVRVIGEDDTGAQLVDQTCRIGRAGYLSRAAVPAARCPGSAGEEYADGGQVGKYLVLADVGVPGPARSWAGGADVEVAAPVGGLAVGPGRFRPPPAPPPGQQPG